MSLLDRVAKWIYWHGWIGAGFTVRVTPGPTFRVRIVPFGGVLWLWAYRRNERRLILREGHPVRPWHREMGVLP